MKKKQKRSIQNNRQDYVNSPPLNDCESNIRIFATQKNGNTLDEYEDAYSCEKPFFSVADGATESSFSKEWAKLLVTGFSNNKGAIKKDLKDILNLVISNAQAEWCEMLKTKTILWHAEEKVKRGAHAAFIGLRLINDYTLFRKKMKWESISVGDSCLFVIRNDALIESFPIKKSSDFNSSPFLMSSVGKNDDIEMEISSGDLKGGDCIYLLTDAIAQWFLGAHENNKLPWKMMNDIKNKEEFQLFIDGLRSAHAIKNDDVTVMNIVIPD
ncbi:MAG: hypothetical protein Q7T53_09155 [Deltaproteobacteria bacterium]|nr:hypothetical protein [Deltaproteobacteria bacterium]